MKTKFRFQRRTWIIGGLVIGLPVLAVAWYLLSPLFLNRTVIEDFPRAALAEIPDDMSTEEVETEMLAAEELVEPVQQDMPADPVALVTGEIMGADSFHRGAGTATIYELDDGSRVLRLEDIDITNGPDLHVLLSPVADPQGRDEVTAAGYVDLGALKGNRGSQNYDIPADFVIGDEISVVIYCVPFHVVFSTASLAQV